RRAFGGLAAAPAFAFLALSFFARFDVIGGSPLRWDWTCALLLGAAALARRAPVAAGLGLGYAVLARIFPALFLLPLAAKWLQARRTGARDPGLTRCLAAAAALTLTVTLALVAVSGSRALSEEFAAKIRLHNQNVYTNHVGLGSVIAFHTAPWTERPDGTVFVPHEAALAARPPSWVLLAVSVLYLLVALPLMLKAPPLESMMYAVPLVFCALSPAGYYYSFLVLLVLLPWRDGVADPVRLVAMGLLALVGAAAYAFEMASPDYFPLFYKVSIQLGVFFLFWLVFEYVRLAAPLGRGAGAVIDESSEIDGKYTFSGTVMLNGKFKGEISSNDTLIIGEKAVVKASIRAGVILISGEVVGNVLGTERVELRGTARVFGDVEAPVVVVEEGVMFEGQCRMTKRPA